MGIAFAYVGLVLFVPFLNVFVQVCTSPLAPTSSLMHLQPADASPLNVSCPNNKRPLLKGAMSLQAFGNGVGPFVEHLMDEDFLHAVSSIAPRRYYYPLSVLTGHVECSAGVQ